MYWFHSNTSHIFFINYWVLDAVCHQVCLCDSALLSLSLMPFTPCTPFIHFSHFINLVHLCGCSPSCFVLFHHVPFARCDITLIVQKHVERSDISQGIRSKAGSLCNWQLVFGARGLLGMNVVSVTPDLASCWRGIGPRGVQQNAFVNLVQAPCELWTGGKLAAQTCGMQSSLFPCFGNRGGPWN